MDQHQIFVPMSDHMVTGGETFDEPLSSPFGSLERAGHRLYGDLGPSRFLKIDKKWLIDPRQLSIGSMISEGPYSVVYEGLYKSKPVAIKVIQPDKTSSVTPERIEKFEREIAMLSRVKHDNILKFIGAYVEPTMMIITELMRGGTLQKYLWSIRPNSPDLKLSITFALGISRAMEYLHSSSIIHRDLKPSNLLLTDDRKRIKVADFGLARESMGEMTAEAGTYRWMAPELFSVEPVKLGVKKHYNHKVDVYSFSMVLWELLTNSTPLKGRNNVMVAYAAAMNQRPGVEDIPEDIAPLLQSCWAEDPADRPEFAQITEFLVNFLRNMSSAQTKPPKVLEIECTDHLMNHNDKSRGKKNKGSSPCFMSCFDDCFSNGFRLQR